LKKVTANNILLVASKKHIEGKISFEEFLIVFEYFYNKRKEKK
jgi:hypothetical protein